MLKATATAACFAAMLPVLLCACGRPSRSEIAVTTSVKSPKVAPNGVRCTDFVAGASYLSCEERVPGRPGVRCSGAFGPNVRKPPRLSPPISYAFSDVGRRGVPALDASTAALFDRIDRYLKSKTLRFAYPLRGPQKMVVYDATRGPCDPDAYQVLNLPGVHNAMYRPGDDPYEIMAYPMDWTPTPFPWMRAH